MVFVGSAGDRSIHLENNSFRKHWSVMEEGSHPARSVRIRIVPSIFIRILQRLPWFYRVHHYV